MTKLRDSRNQSQTKAPFTTLLGALAQADGTTALRLGVREGEPGPQGHIPEFKHDTGRLIHFGAEAGATSIGDPSYTEAYFLATDSWHQLPSVGHPIVDTIGFVIDGLAYLFSGHVLWRQEQDGDGWQYNPATETWTSKANAPRSFVNLDGDPTQPGARRHAGGEAITEYGGARQGRSGFITGGRREAVNDFQFYNTTSRYDVGTDQWITTGGTLVPGRSNMGTTVLNGEMYLFGGETWGDGGVDTDFIALNQSFAPAPETWTTHTPLQDLPPERIPEGQPLDSATAPRADMATTSLNGLAHLLGATGEGSDFPQPRHDTFDWHTQVWTALAPYFDALSEFNDPGALLEGWPANWGAFFPNKVFWRAAACTLRGGIHMTGGIEGVTPWEFFPHQTSRHVRWSQGDWVHKKTPEHGLLALQRMGVGWEQDPNTGFVREIAFGPRDEPIKEDGHLMLTL